MVAQLRSVGTVTADPYNLDPKFERAVAALCCTRPQFLGAVADVLEPADLGTPEAQLLVTAAIAHFRQTGNGPPSEDLVFQRLRNLMTEGKVTMAQVRAADAYLEVGMAHVAGARRGYEAYLAELAPILRRRAQMAALKLAAESHARGTAGDEFADAFAAARRSASIGQVDLSAGTTLMGGMDEIAASRSNVFLPLGIDELDGPLGGGMVRGALGYVLAEPGHGKSMFLTQVFGNALARGHFGVYVTLEVTVPHTFGRLIANLVDEQVNDVMSGRRDEVIRQKLASAAMGPMYLKSMPSSGTTTQDVFDWVERCEQHAGRAVDVLVVDYADKLHAKRAERDSLYLSMKDVYEALHQWPVDHNGWCWTASQPKDKGGAKILGLGHSADSKHKERATDLGVALNVDDDMQAMSMNLFKHRHGEWKGQTAKLPTEYRFGRVVARSRYAHETGPRPTF